MRLLYLLILCHFFESRSALHLPWREVDISERMETRRRFHWLQLAPEFTGKGSKKYLVPYGDTDDPVDTIIESIPVAERIAGLTMLGRVSARGGAFAILNLQSFDTLMKDYINNLIGNMYLELGLVEMFIQFAYAREFGGQAIPRNAVSFVKYMREYSEQHFGHSLKFFSPRMLIDWLTIFKQRGLFRIEIRGSRFDPHTSAESISPDALINLETGVWKQLLINRLNRLLLTGYENIDL